MLRPVEVWHEGRWIPATLMATRRDGVGCSERSSCCPRAGSGREYRVRTGTTVLTGVPLR